MNKFVKLKDVASLTVGFVGNMTKEYTSSGIAFFRSLNIKPFYIDARELLHISFDFNEKIQKSRLQEGDVVIVRTGQPGACCVIPKEYDGCNCSDLIIVRPNKEIINPYFLEAYINFMTQKQINNHQVGAIQKHFNVGSAKEMLLCLPELSIQRRCAKIVNILNRKIQVNNKVIKELESMAKTIYDYWFLQFEFPNEEGQPYKSSGGKMVWNDELGKEIPEGWKVTAIKDLLKVVTGNVDANFSSIDGQYKFFTCAHEVMLCSQYAFEGNAVLIVGNGDFNVKHYSGKFNAYQRTYVLISEEKKYYAAIYMAVKERIMLFKKGSNGSIIKFIKKRDVEEIPILVPNKDILFDSMNELLISIESKRAENEELISLRNFLLPLLMNGQVKLVNLEK